MAAGVYGISGSRVMTSHFASLRSTKLRPSSTCTRTSRSSRPAPFSTSRLTSTNSSATASTSGLISTMSSSRTSGWVLTEPDVVPVPKQMTSVRAGSRASATGRCASMRM